MSVLAENILDLHGVLALLLVFALVALEASAFIGFLFPGEIACILGGVLAFQGGFRWWPPWSRRSPAPSSETASGTPSAGATANGC